MKPISRRDAEAAFDRFYELAEDEAVRRFERFGREQPFLMTYLLAGDEEFTDESRRGELLELGLIVYEAMSGGRALPQVAEDRVLSSDEANMQMLTSLDEGSEFGAEAAMERMLTSYNQRELLGVVLEFLMEGNEETPELAPAGIGMSLLHVKTAIDCFDR
jgi:hypothetical protein